MKIKELTIYKDSTYNQYLAFRLSNNTIAKVYFCTLTVQILIMHDHTTEENIDTNLLDITEEQFFLISLSWDNEYLSIELCKKLQEITNDFYNNRIRIQDFKQYTIEY